MKVVGVWVATAGECKIRGGRYGYRSEVMVRGVEIVETEDKGLTRRGGCRAACSAASMAGR